MELNGKLIISKVNENVVSSLFENDELVEINILESDISILGNIYIGKVKNIVKNINAAFVEIANKEICYLSLEDNKNVIFTNSKSNDKLLVGDEIIVQVSKENIKTKAPVVTTKINLTGKYVVLIYGKPTLGISNKIKDSKIREHFKELLNDKIVSDYGFIIRTNAKDVSDDVFIDEINNLINLFEKIKKIGCYRTCYSLIEKNPSSFICDIRDSYSNAIHKIITDDKNIFEEIKNYLSDYQSEDLGKLSLYNDKLISLNKLYSIEHKLNEALKQRVWLRSGAYIIIQPTEAFVVIDVNTGKFVGNKKSNETFLKINLEAAKEISKQIRLRNLSGIIVIDFIDMQSDEDKNTLMNELERYLRVDSVKTTLVGMSKLNLVEITRKKVRKPLHEQCMVVCPKCGGTGMCV